MVGLVILSNRTKKLICHLPIGWVGDIDLPLAHKKKIAPARCIRQGLRASVMAVRIDVENFLAIHPVERELQAFGAPEIMFL